MLTVNYNIKKSILTLLTFLPLMIFGQVDSLFGTYVTATMGNSPIIKLFSDSTFSYKSSIDVGYIPETFGYLKFSDDTVYFNYKQKIHPEITDFSSRLNPDYEHITPLSVASR
jgi:hypothetical protein